MKLGAMSPGDAPAAWPQGALPALALGSLVERHAGPPADWRHNRLLAALPETLWQRCSAPAQCLQLRQGQTLHEAGAPLHWVYFPLTALMSLSMQDHTGEAIELATVGREGVIGLPWLDGHTTRSRAVVQQAGRAIRLPALALSGEFAREPAVRELLLAYSQVLVAQVMQTALCSRHHAIEQQLSRLILLRLDQQDGDGLSMTQESMAGMLGVRRESVTLAAARLQQAGLIRYTRGRIEVLARAALEGRSCGCYAAIRREFTRLV